MNHANLQSTFFCLWFLYASHPLKYHLLALVALTIFQDLTRYYLWDLYYCCRGLTLLR